MSLKIAARSLKKRPLFTTAVVLTLGIGLGANLAVFSVVDSVLLRSLPYPDEDSLVAIWSTVQRNADDVESIERRSMSMPDIADLREGVGSLDAVASYTNGSFRLGGERPERLIGTIADAQYFSVLGFEPLIGRGLSDEAIGEEGVAGVVLAHALWQRSYGGDPQVLGEVITLNDESAEIVGVMPAGFRGLVDGSDLWFPLAVAGERQQDRRGSRWLESVGRLAPTASIEQARLEAENLFLNLEREYPDDNRGYSVGAAPLAEELVGEVQQSLLLLLAAVTGVLLIALVNVINLLVVQLRRRSGDIATRRALGASQTVLFKGFLAEAILLASMGALLGAGIALFGVKLLQPLAPVGMPGLYELGVGTKAVVLLAVLTLVLGMAAGAGAMLRVPKGNPLAALAARTRVTHRDALSSTLLVGEVALAVLLTIAAGLLVRSFWNMNEVDPGMVRADVGFLRVDLNEGRSTEQLPAARANLLDVVRGIGSVEAVALTSDAPFLGRSSATVATPEGRVPVPGQPYSGGTRIYRHMVSPGYFGALEIPLLQGRDFNQGDTLPWDDESTGPGAPGVAVVSKVFADLTWPNGDALGQRFFLGPPVDEIEQAERRPWFEVVGVVADHRHRNLIPDPDNPEDPDVFFAMEQFNSSAADLVVRSSLPTETLLRQIESELKVADSSMVTFAPQSLEAVLAQQTARSRFSGLLMACFAGLSLVLAAIGVYGVVANSVEQRRREVGIRMALGADRTRIVREVMVPSAVMVAAGLAIGLLGAVLSARLLESMVFEIGTRDVAVYLFSVLSLLAVGMVATVIPARRASRIEPREALQGE